MEPVTRDLRRRIVLRRDVLGDELRSQRYDVLEHAAAVPGGTACRCCPASTDRSDRDSLRVVADVARPLRRHLRRQDLPRRVLRAVGRLDDERDRRVAEDEVAVALAPVHVTGGEARARRPARTSGAAGLDGLMGDDGRAGGCRAAEGHVETEAARAERFLDLDRDPRDRGAAGSTRRGRPCRRLRRCDSRASDRSPGCVDRVLGLDADLILGPILDVRTHALGIELCLYLSSTRKRLMMPEALTTNSGVDSLSGLRVPAAISAACLAFSRRTNSLNASQRLGVFENGCPVPDTVSGDRSSCRRSCHNGWSWSQDRQSVHSLRMPTELCGLRSRSRPGRFAGTSTADLSRSPS